MGHLVMGKQKDEKQGQFIATNTPRWNPQLIEQDIKEYRWVMLDMRWNSWNNMQALESHFMNIILLAF